MATSPPSAAPSLATRAVARSLGLKTLPEGLKEASQRAMLLEIRFGGLMELGGDLGQGY